MRSRRNGVINYLMDNDLTAPGPWDVALVLQYRRRRGARASRITSQPPTLTGTRTRVSRSPDASTSNPIDGAVVEAKALIDFAHNQAVIATMGAYFAAEA